MKRIVFIVLTIIAFASLSACGSNSNTTVDNAERVAESTSEKSAVLTVDADNAKNGVRYCKATVLMTLLIRS